MARSTGTISSAGPTPTHEVEVVDEFTSGGCEPRFVLRLASERIRARELLERRVEEEVRRYNEGSPNYFRGLLRPSETERVLNGEKVAKRKPLDPEEQVRVACRAFENNAFLMFLDEEQITDLDQQLVLKQASRARFLKLVPLVGG